MIRRPPSGLSPAQANQTRVTPGSGCTKELAYVHRNRFELPMRERIAIDVAGQVMDFMYVSRRS